MRTTILPILAATAAITSTITPVLAAPSPDAGLELSAPELAKRSAVGDWLDNLYTKAEIWWYGTKKGFVTVDGKYLKVNNKRFYFAGTNAYWWSFISDIKDVEKAMDQSKAAGLSVVRTWGFREINETYVPEGLPKYGGEGAGPSTIYYQIWKDGKPSINYGENGLKRFDDMFRLAEKKNIKYVFVLTNNWADYGGMDVYTVNLGGKYHDDFYTNRKIIDAYKNYVKVIVERYKDSPAIFSWQLGNEPRCGADGNRNLPRSPNCTTETIIKWAREISGFIRKLDPHHLITVGDEGFFNDPTGAVYGGALDDWAYTGADGVDNEALTRLPDISYGVFHAYADWWTKSPEWVTQWAKDHAKMMDRVKKPVVFEEYGWLTDEKRLEYLGRVSNYTRIQAISPWQETIIQKKLSGGMYWQLGIPDLSFGRSTDDGFTIFNDSPEAPKLIYEHARKMNRFA